MKVSQANYPIPKRPLSSTTFSSIRLRRTWSFESHLFGCCGLSSERLELRAFESRGALQLRSCVQFYDDDLC